MYSGLAAVFKGATEDSYHGGRAARGEGPVDSSTYHKMLDVVYTASTAVSERIMKQNREDLRNDLARGCTEVIAMDAGWFQKGHTSAGAWLPILRYSNKSVLYMRVAQKHRRLNGIIVRAGNHKYSSGAMEVSIMDLGLTQMEEDGLLELLLGAVVDQDAGSRKLLREKYPSLAVFLDPGHCKKGFVKDLKKVFKELKAYRGLAARIASWFMRCLKAAEREAKKASGEEHPAGAVIQALFLARFAHTSRHYSTMECLPSCPCHEQDAANAEDMSGSDEETRGPDVETLMSEAATEAQDATDWLEVEASASEVVTTAAAAPSLTDVNLAGMKRWDTHCSKKAKSCRVYLSWDDKKWGELSDAIAKIIAKAPMYCHAYDTCNAESIHAERTRVMPKDKVGLMAPPPATDHI